MQDVAKFERLYDFAMNLARIRRKVRQDLSLRGLPRDKVLAAVVRLLDSSYIRIGNERYEKQNDSFGITTMRSKHLVVSRNELVLRFPGKGGQKHRIEVKDAKLAKVLKRCDELPGRRLLQYRENGDQGVIHSEDVNEYLSQISGARFTAKDFRTWGGSVRATQRLIALGPAESASQRRRNIVDAYRYAAEALGNTVAVCRKYYVHPAITLAYEEGRLEQMISLAARRKLPGLKKIERGVAGVVKHSSDEALRRWIADAA